MKCKFSSDLKGHFLPHPEPLYPSVNLVPVIFTMCLLGTVAIQGRCAGNLALCHYCQKPAVATSAIWGKKGYFCSVVFCKLVKNCCFLALISVLQMVTTLLLEFLCAKNVPAQLPLQQHVCASPMEVTGHKCFTSLNFLPLHFSKHISHPVIMCSINTVCLQTSFFSGISFISAWRTPKY